MNQPDDTFDRLLRRLGQGPPDSPLPQECPDEHLVAAYLDGGLSETEQARMVAHLADCRHCRQVLAIQAAGFRPSSTQAQPAQTAPGATDNLDEADSTARFEAELAAVEASLGILPKAPAADLRPHVLIVDDDVLYLSALADTLAPEFHVTACGSGGEALQRVDDHVRTIVLDIKMAGLNGLDVADRLKADGHAVPIIFNTGYPGDFVREDIESRYRPFGYATKDDPDHLLACVRQAAGSQAQLPA